jgi:hypothetical protein
MSKPTEFPLPSLRQFLIPDQVVHFRSFIAANIEELDHQINEWVRESKAIIAVPGTLTLLGDQGVSLCLTYVNAVEST